MAIAPKLVRDRRIEDIKARCSLATNLSSIAVERSTFPFDSSLLFRVAHFLVLCALPYRQTAERQIIRKARLGDGTTLTVIFTAVDPDVAMPFGADRIPLHWAINRAISHESPIVYWDEIGEYFDEMGMRKGGRAYEELAARWERILSLDVFIKREGRDLPVIERQGYHMIEASRLPKSLRPGHEGLFASNPEFKDRCGFRFNSLVFDQILKANIPVLRSLITATRKRSQLQDYMLFLIWRSYGAETESLIPWDKLREQLWSEDTNPYRLKSRMEQAIDHLHHGTGWNELNAHAMTKGLLIGPPKNGVQFMPEGRVRRKLGILPGSSNKALPTR